MSAGFIPFNDQMTISMRSKTRILLANPASNKTSGFNETNFFPYNQTRLYNTTVTSSTSSNWDILSADFWNINNENVRMHPLKWCIIIGSPVLFILIMCIFICLCCRRCKRKNNRNKTAVSQNDSDPEEVAIENNHESDGFDPSQATHSSKYQRIPANDPENDPEEEPAETPEIAIERNPLIQEEEKEIIENQDKGKFPNNDQNVIQMAEHSRESSKISTTKSVVSPAEILENIEKKDSDDSMEDMYGDVEQTSHHHQITMNGINVPTNGYQHQYPYNYVSMPTSPISNYSNNQLIQPHISYHHQNTPSLPGEGGLNTFISKSQWSTEQVAEWVGGLGKIFKKYVQNFRDHGINGLSLCQYGNNPDKLKTVFGKVVSDEVHRDNIVVNWIHLPCTCKCCSDSLEK